MCRIFGDTGMEWFPLAEATLNITIIGNNTAQ